MPIGDPKDEYKEVSANMRQYGNMRFAQLTLFIAMTGGLLAALFTSNPPLSSLARFLLKIGGLIITVVFWIMEERAVDYWYHFRRRAVDLEKQLGYQQYLTGPERSIVTATNAVRVLYLFMFLFWVVTLILHTRF